MKKLLCIFLLTSCNESYQIVPVAPIDSSTPIDQEPTPKPVIPKRADWCDKGCAHLMTLPGQDGNKGCLEARPLVYPDGKVQSCADFCRETQSKGRDLNPKCWVEMVTQCSEIDEVCRW